MKYIGLVLCLVGMLGGCVTPSGQRTSLVDVKVTAIDADVLALAVTRMVSDQLPPAATTIVLARPREGAGSDIAIRVEERLRWAGFGIVEAVPNARDDLGAVNVQYSISSLDSRILVQVYVAKVVLTQMFAPGRDGGLTAVSAVARRTVS